MNTSILRNKYRASLLGVLVGDCLGAPFEGRQVDPNLALDQIYRLVQTPRDGPLPYTDDTSMTISTCKSLLANKGVNPKHLAKEYTEAYFSQPNRGYGGAVRRVFEKLRDSDYQDPFGPASEQFQGHGSFGNGAAMRCNGIALFAHKNQLDVEATVDLVDKCSRVTHSHPDAINGAIMLVLAIRQALDANHEAVDEFSFLNDLLDSMKRIEGIEDHVYSDKLKLIRREMESLAVDGKEISQKQIVRLLGNDVSALGSVPLAIYSFIRGISKFVDRYQIDNEFTRTLHWAISCGGDTDTIASMACGLCGAYMGLENIPERLYSKCEDWQQVSQLADEMAALQVD